MMSKKILFIGNYRDGTGWGHAALGYILALDKAGYDVVCRPLRFNNISFPLPNRILELEAKSDYKPDVVIQNTLPHFFEYDGAAKQIGLAYFETSNFTQSTWPEYCNLMDELWVPCEHNAIAAKQSGVTKPIKVIPFAFDTSVYDQTYPAFAYKDACKFTFYYIGEFNKRKNIAALLKAFHTEFGLDEQVELIIKTTPAGLPQNFQEHIGEYINEVKKGLKLYPTLERYHKEKVICEYWDDSVVYGLHQTCDCFVTASYGEAFAIPCVDAMGFGKKIVAPRHTGFLDYLNSDEMVVSYPDDCFGAVGGFADLYTATSEWYNVSIKGLRHAMRTAFEQEKVTFGRARVEAFSLDNIAGKLKEVLG